MTTMANILQYLSPVLAMAIAVVLFCFYLYVKRKKTSNNVSIPTTQDGNTSFEFHTASPPGGQAEEHQRCDRFPPRYSTVDHPPPYSLFDPKQTSVWPGVPPPAYEMYPITLPLAPYSWMTPAPEASAYPNTLT